VFDGTLVKLIKFPAEHLTIFHGTLVYHGTPVENHCFRGQVLKRFRKLKHIVHDFLEEKDDLPKERALLCNENWLLDLGFLTDVTSYVNYSASLPVCNDKSFQVFVFFEGCHKNNTFLTNLLVQVI